MEKLIEMIDKKLNRLEDKVDKIDEKVDDLILFKVKAMFSAAIVSALVCGAFQFFLVFYQKA